MTVTAADGTTARASSAFTSTVKRLSPTVTVSAPRSVSATKRARVTVRVSTKHLSSKPRGTVRLSYGSRSTTVKLTARHRGKVTVRLPRLAAGTRVALRARFTPSATLARYALKATSARRTLLVR